MIPVIEFFGLPGSGKTYLRTLLTTELANRYNLHVYSREEASLQGLRKRDDGSLTRMAKKFHPQLWHRIIHEDYCLQEMLNFASLNPAFMAYVFDFLEESCPTQEHIRSILGAVTRTVIEFELLKNVEVAAHKVVLADEWFNHRIFTLFGNCRINPSHDQLHKYIQICPPSICSVFIATPPEICMDRMEQRKRMPVFLGGYSVDEKMQLLKKAFSTLHDLADQLIGQGRTVVVYDGCSQSIEEIVVPCKKSLGIDA